MNERLPYPPRQIFYGGKSQKSSGPIFQSIDPSTARPLADVHSASNGDVDLAIASAAKAFPSWSKTPYNERSRILLRAVSLLRERNDELAKVETHDTGKPFSETSTVDIVTGADVLEYYAHWIGGGGMNGETTSLREDAWVYTTKEALGVCVGIGAWNYPIQMCVDNPSLSQRGSFANNRSPSALWKSAPCLAAGNTMVYKPSEVTPLHSQILAELYTEAGLPPGVFNVVYGAGDVGAYLTSHPSIAKVSFTGQVSTGQKVAASAAGRMKYVTMELGGKSPLIILPDADLEQAVDGAMMANFFSTGQVCTNGTRVFISAKMKSAFETRLVEKMKFVRAGDLMYPKTNFGPLVSKIHFGKVTGYIKDGIEVDGAKLLYGGLQKPSISSRFSSGYWITPTVFTECHDGMKIVKEEIFGPVMTILTYDSVEEAIRRANNTTLGLAAGVFTKDLNLAHKVINQLQAGITWINSWGESPADMSVGGWKMSGVGVENGTKGIEAWVRTKSTLVDMGGKVATVFTEE